jgi:hypothetical protein
MQPQDPIFGAPFLFELCFIAIVTFDSFCGGSSNKKRAKTRYIIAYELSRAPFQRNAVERSLIFFATTQTTMTKNGIILNNQNHYTLQSLSFFSTQCTNIVASYKYCGLYYC